MERCFLSVLSESKDLFFSWSANTIQIEEEESFTLRSVEGFLHQEQSIIYIDNFLWFLAEKIKILTSEGGESSTNKHWFLK